MCRILTRVLTEYFNPYSNQFQIAKEEFNTLSCCQKTMVVAATILALPFGIITSIPAFRIAVSFYRPTRTLLHSDDSTVSSTHQTGVSTLKPVRPFLEMVEAALVKHPRTDGTSSRKTLVCKEVLKETLESKNKKFEETIDNGNCFYDAFVKGLKTPCSIQEARNIVKQKVDQLKAGPDQSNWIKSKMIHSRLGTAGRDQQEMNYQKFCEDVGKMDTREGPLWGEIDREGRILCEHFNVSITIYEVGNLSDDRSEVAKAGNYFFSNKTYHSTPSNQSTIEIANYPGHFMAVR